MEHLRIHEQREGRDPRGSLLFGIAASAVGLLLVAGLGVYLLRDAEPVKPATPPAPTIYVVRDMNGKPVYTIERERR